MSAEKKFKVENDDIIFIKSSPISPPLHADTTGITPLGAGTEPRITVNSPSSLSSSPAEHYRNSPSNRSLGSPPRRQTIFRFRGAIPERPRNPRSSHSPLSRSSEHSQAPQDSGGSSPRSLGPPPNHQTLGNTPGKFYTKNQPQYRGKSNGQNHGQNQGQKRRREEYYEDENIIENLGAVFETLQNNKETVSTADVETQLDITAKVMLYSDMVELSIGESQTKFLVYKDLLAIHSPFFRNRFARDARAPSDGQIFHIRDVRPVSFRLFLSWVNTGRLITTPNEFADIWVLGDIFNIPALQNLAMEFCFNLGKQYATQWPDTDWIKHMYEISRRGTALRQFAAHSVIWHKPFEIYPIGSEKYTEWKYLVEDIPDLSFDMSVAAGKDWGGGSPWDDFHKAAYLVKVKPFTEMWEAHILSQRTRAQLEQAAKTTCLRSRIELEHLNRKR